MTPQRQVKGYTIRGAQHKPRCKCRACRIVRMRAREKAVSDALFELRHC